MKRRSIVYGDGVKSDILATTDFIAHDSATSATNALTDDKALQRLELRLGTLATLPERGRVVPELNWHGIASVREVIEKPWRILYQIRPNEVLMVAVFDGRRILNDVVVERIVR